MEKPSTLEAGQEHHEFITEEGKQGKARRLCHYYYRHFNGILYSCVKRSLKACVEARDTWLEDEASKAGETLTA